MDEELGRNTFLLPDAQLPERRDTAYQRLRHGEMIVERLNKGGEETQVPHGLIHHWAGIVFISGATVEQTLALIQDYDHHQDVYSPEVMRSRLVRRQGDTYHIFLCLRKHKVTTVVLESEYDVHFVRLDAHRAYSRSHSTRIAEVENPGGRSEHDRPPGNDHGYMWALDTYWRFLEAKDGLFIQCEAISLSRDIPTGSPGSSGHSFKVFRASHLSSSLPPREKQLPRGKQHPPATKTSRRMTMFVRSQPAEPQFTSAQRVQQSLSSGVEKKVLLWLAPRTPAGINSDHLTLLGFAAQFLVVSYAMARWNRYALLAATFFIAINWLGDSLDGTLARFRNQQRPRYGFYVDHIIDTFGAAFLMCGLATSGYLHWGVAIAILIIFLMLSIEVYLATYTLGNFQLSYWVFGPTEIRILLAIGNVTLLYRPTAHFLGHAFRLFDAGGVIAVAGIGVMLIVSTVRHTAALYSQETVR